MNGLIRNNFYSMENNLKIVFILAAALVFTPLMISNAAIYPIIIAVQMFLFVSNTGTTLHADEVAKWDKFEMTLPIKRSTIIIAKYIIFAILILCGLFMSLCTAICISLSGQTPNISSILWGYEYGLIISVISVSLMYPIILKIGTDKIELVFILSSIAAIGFMYLVVVALSPATDGINPRHPLVGVVIISSAILIFIISFIASLKIHKKKEF